MGKATTKSVKTLGDKLDKVSDGFSVSRYDNGYMIEVSGKQEDDYATAKILVGSIEELVTLVREYDSMNLQD